MSRLPNEIAPFLFIEGVKAGPTKAAKQGTGSVELVLRSNEIKAKLHQLLLQTSDAKFVDEIASRNGGRIDLVALLPSGEYDFYEIKPAVLAKHAIREALPQLLEYAYRRGGKQPRRLVIVSQANLDDDSKHFLQALREKDLPVHYQQIDLEIQAC